MTQETLELMVKVRRLEYAVLMLSNALFRDNQEQKAAFEKVFDKLWDPAVDALKREHPEVTWVDLRNSPTKPPAL